MPTPDTADYEFRQPLETAQTTLDDLWSQWDKLGDAAQSELTAILTSLRARLYQAEGDLARGTAMASLLYALDGANHVPQAVTELLRNRRRSTTRGSVVFYSDDNARAVFNRIDRLIGKDPGLAPSEAPSASEEEFLEAGTTVTKVIRSLNTHWKELSLRRQDQAATWLQEYYNALESAGNDYLRLEATYAFLRHIKDDPVIYELVFRVFRGPAPQPSAESYSPGMAAMSANDAGAIKTLINQNPSLAAFPKTPWGYDVSFGLAESAPPPGLPDQATEPAVVDYHTDVRFPGQVSTFDRAIPLRVRLTLDRAEGTAVDASVSVEFVTPEPQPVLVVCNAEGFVEETGDLTRTIMVYQGRDSQTAIFLLTPDPDAGPGVRRISLDFHHRGRPAGTANFEVEVRDRPPVAMTPARVQPLIEEKTGDGAETAAVTGGIVLGAANLEPPDFELRIALSADRRTLTYTLHSPAGWQGMVHKPMGSIRLSVDNPRALLENTLSRLSGMSRMAKDRRSAQDTDHNRFEIRQIGTFLYETLFTDELRQAYREMRNVRIEQEKAGKSVSLLVLSDEPWIPWEMIRPYENDLTNEDFLCDQFRLTRWLAGRGLPDNFSLSMAQIVAPASNLEAVQQEQEYFLKTVPAKYPSITVPAPSLKTVVQVAEAMSRGNTQLFHFACHGDFDATNPDDSMLRLGNGSLTPSQIVGALRVGVTTSRPVIFLNACHTAESQFGWTGIGGWAVRFVNAGASAFIGSLWEVNDKLAAELALKFYGELLAGKTLGDAFHAARLHIRTMDDANPTWLAYTLYADPNGKVKNQSAANRGPES